MKEDRGWLPVKEFAKRNGFGANLVYESVRTGRLPSIRLGAKILIPSDALDRMLEAESRKESGG